MSTEENKKTTNKQKEVRMKSEIGSILCSASLFRHFKRLIVSAQIKRKENLTHI